MSCAHRRPTYDTYCDQCEAELRDALTEIAASKHVGSQRQPQPALDSLAAQKRAQAALDALRGR